MITFDSLHDWTARFISQLASPNAQYAARKITDGPMIEYLIDPVSDSIASLTPREDGTSEVREAGPVALWSQVEHAITSWQQSGSPGVEQFRIEIAADCHRVYVAEHESLSWALL